jgi:hypothetical protein
MLWKQHTGFKSRLLAVLFLFFNCVCAAAPVLKLSGETYKEAVPIALPQNSNPSENEEESHASASGYINHCGHFSVRKQHEKRVYHAAGPGSTISFSGIDLPNSYATGTNIFPLPGYYAFLFRYTLF